MSEALLRRRSNTAFLAPLIPHLPTIAATVGGALGGILGGQQQPQPQIRAGTPLSSYTPVGQTLAQSRAGGGALAPPALTPIEQLIKGAGRPTGTITSTQGTIAPNRSSAKVGQYYYSSSGKVYKKHRSKKRKKTARRRKRLTKRDKFHMIAQAAAGGASPQVISILLMM